MMVSLLVNLAGILVAGGCVFLAFRSKRNQDIKPESVKAGEQINHEKYRHHTNPGQ